MKYSVIKIYQIVVMVLLCCTMKSRGDNVNSNQNSHLEKRQGRTRAEPRIFHLFSRFPTMNINPFKNIHPFKNKFNLFSRPRPTNSYRPPVNHGPPQHVSNNYGPPKPQNNYGPPEPQNNYGPPEQQNNGHHPPQQDNNNYGPPKETTEYGPPKQPSNEYGSPEKPQENQIIVGNFDGFGPPKPDDEIEIGAPQNSYQSPSSATNGLYEQPKQTRHESDFSGGSFSPSTSFYSSSQNNDQNSHNEQPSTYGSNSNQVFGPPKDSDVTQGQSISEQQNDFYGSNVGGNNENNIYSTSFESDSLKPYSVETPQPNANHINYELSQNSVNTGFGPPKSIVNIGDQAFQPPSSITFQPPSSNSYQPASNNQSPQSPSSTSYQPPQSPPSNTYQPSQNSVNNGFGPPKSYVNTVSQTPQNSVNNGFGPPKSFVNTVSQTPQNPSSNAYQPPSGPVNDYQAPAAPASNVYQQPQSYPTTLPSNSNEYESSEFSVNNNYQPTQPIISNEYETTQPSANNNYEPPSNSINNNYQTPPSLSTNSYQTPQLVENNRYQPPQTFNTNQYQQTTEPSLNDNYQKPRVPENTNYELPKISADSIYTSEFSTESSNFKSNEIQNSVSYLEANPIDFPPVYRPQSEAPRQSTNINRLPQSTLVAQAVKPILALYNYNPPQNNDFNVINNNGKPANFQFYDHNIAFSTNIPGILNENSRVQTKTNHNSNIPTDQNLSINYQSDPNGIRTNSVSPISSHSAKNFDDSSNDFSTIYRDNPPLRSKDVSKNRFNNNKRKRRTPLTDGNLESHSITDDHWVEKA